MNVFETYGIKEVADVTFYDTSTNVPVLYLDTLKVSTMETTAQQVSANGGKGNSPLVIWDFGKEITLTLEDALFSMKSMAMMMGGKSGKQAKVDRARGFTCQTDGIIPSDLDIPATAVIYDSNGKVVAPTAIVAGQGYIASWQDDVNGGADTITISAESFPGTYKIAGLTYARNQDGVDEFFQFIVPRAKMGADNTITMQAEGDPSTFTMTMRVMRPQDGNMVKLLKFPKKENSVIVDVTGVTVTPTTMALTVGQTGTLAADIQPVDASDKTVIWSSNAQSIATVDANGVVTAMGPGVANITVATVDGGFTAMCVVTVTGSATPVTGVSLDQNTLTVDVGDTEVLVATVSPANATNKTVFWSTDDSAVATVLDGTVTGVAVGTCNIKVQTDDGGFTDTCAVTVQ